jgi:hypothetical protein
MKRLTPILLAALLTACAAPQAQAPTATIAPPTATIAPPTATIAPPTATRVPPTATPVPPTATTIPAATAAAAAPAGGAGGALGDALAQTAAATSYRLDLTVTGKGAIQAVPTGDAPMTLIAMTGAFAGDEYEYNLKGAVAAMLAANPQTGVQAISAGGANYLHGPIPLLGATEDAWYTLDPAQAAMTAPPVSANSTAGALARANPNFAGFVPGPEEQRGGQSCRRYTGDRAATLGLLKSLGQTGLPVESDPARIKEASAALVACADGYLYDLDLAYSGTTAADPPAPFSLDLRLRLSDFDASITITPPQNARPLPTPTR